MNHNQTVLGIPSDSGFSRNALIALLACQFLIGAAANAQQIEIGDLSYSGSGDIITDSESNREWLRWDVLADKNYAGTLDWIAAEDEGWKIAGINDAQDFTDALLSGFTNDCSIGDSGATLCAPSTSTDLAALTGQNYVDGLFDAAFFLTGDSGQVGMLYHFCDVPDCTDSRVFKNNDWGDTPDKSLTGIEKSDLHSQGPPPSYASQPPISWLLYRDATPVPEVSAAGALAAFSSLLALMAFLWERRRVVV